MHGIVTPAIDLVVNTFERNYRAVLAAGSFALVEDWHQRRFARRIALINNLADSVDARRRAETLLDRGEIDAFHFVADRVAVALATVGLRAHELGRLPSYSDWALVAVTLPDNPWILSWDPEQLHRDPRTETNTRFVAVTVVFRNRRH